MLNVISNPQNKQSTIGKYDDVKVRFQSDEMIVGKAIKVNIALWLNSLLQYSINSNIPAWYGTVPASGMTLLSFSNTDIWKNYKVYIIGVDAKTFDIELRYFNTADLNGFIGLVGAPDLTNVWERSYNGGTSVYDQSKDVLIHADVEGMTATANINQSNSFFCERNFTFENTRFKAGEDLVIKFNSTDPISQSYFAGFYREDTINNNENIVDSLGLNYVEVNNGLITVDSLPNTCIISGINTIYQMGLSQGSFTVDKACLAPNGTYRAYVVYKHLGTWHSCLSEPLKLEGAMIPIIEPSISYSTTDAFGNVYLDGCVKNLPKQGIIEMCVFLDLPAFNAAITTNGYTGDFDDYFNSLVATVGGQTVVSSVDMGMFCANVNTDNLNGEYILNFALTMNYGDHIDVYNFEMKLGVVTNEVNLNARVSQVGNIVDVICAEDGNITITYPSLSGTVDAVLGESGFYSNNGIISETNGTIVINNSFLDLDSEYCIRVIKTDPETGGDCDCPACEDAIVGFTNYISEYGDEQLTLGIPIGATDYVSNAIFYLYNGSTNTDLGSTSTYWSTDPITNNPQPFYVYRVEIDISFKINGCLYFFSGISIQSQQFEPGQSSTLYTTQTIPSSTLTQDCDCPPDPPILVCNNTPSITYSCDPETGTVTASSSGTLGSAVTSDVLEYSTNGTAYQAWPGTITGQAVVYLRRQIVFSDGCPPIELNDTVFCSIVENCDNTLEFTYTLTPTLLTITETPTFTSPIFLDEGLNVSIDGGVTYQLYTTPIVLVGGEDIVMIHNISFADSCPPINIIKTDTNDVVGNCDYNDFAVTCLYDMGLFSATFTGSVTGLELNNKKYSIDGGNTYSPYTGSVAGAMMFLVVWEIKYPNCEKQTIIKACCKPNELAGEDGCLKVCIEGPIQVELPQMPIEVCIVECCEGFTPLFECVNKVLTITNAPPGATYSWTGPNGFTATTNPITMIDEGTYYVQVTDNSTTPPCVSTGQYVFNMPNAGTPISNPIIINS